MSAGPPSVEGGDLGGLPPPGTASRVRVAVAGPVLCITMDSGLELCRGCCFPTASEVAAAELPVLSGRRVRNGQQGSAGLGFPGPPCQSLLQAGLALRLGQARCEPPPTHLQATAFSLSKGEAAHGTRCLFTWEVPPALQPSRIFPLTVHSVPSLPAAFKSCLEYLEGVEIFECWLGYQQRAGVMKVLTGGRVSLGSQEGGLAQEADLGAPFRGQAGTRSLRLFVACCTGQVSRKADFTK